MLKIFYQFVYNHDCFTWLIILKWGNDEASLDELVIEFIAFFYLAFCGLEIWGTMLSRNLNLYSCTFNSFVISRDALKFGVVLNWMNFLLSKKISDKWQTYFGPWWGMFIISLLTPSPVPNLSCCTCTYMVFFFLLVSLYCYERSGYFHNQKRICLSF